MSGDEVQVTLGDLRVLASQTRFDILRSLEGTRCTVSELAEDLDIPRGTVHSHLEKLLETGFVKRHDDEERLWVYYSLTNSGQSLADTDRPRLVVLLTTSTGMIVAGLTSFLYYLSLPRPVPVPPENATSRDGGLIGGPAFTPQDPHLWVLVSSLGLFITGSILLGLIVRGHLAAKSR